MIGWDGRRRWGLNFEPLIDRGWGEEKRGRKAFNKKILLLTQKKQADQCVRLQECQISTYNFRGERKNAVEDIPCSRAV